MVLARIGRPHGLRGEVTVRLHTDDPDSRFTVGASFATDPPGSGPLVLRGVRVHQGGYLLSFEGHPDRTAAEALRGTVLLGPPADDSEDEGWYEEDLVGFAVLLPDGTAVGRVSALHVREVQDLLEVRLATGDTALVPFVEELVPAVDEEARTVVIDPPAGLLELGQ